MNNAIQTTHNLDFTTQKWGMWQEFKVGTVTGLWASADDAYMILTCLNSQPGNGHLTDVFEWFENSCKRDRKDLIVLEIMNDKFARHLREKRKFRPYGSDHMIKKLKDMK